MKNIYLVGHMGAGKTTIGTLLAKYLNVAFRDTDAMVERMFDKPIPVIFADDGEGQFRIYETAAILQTTLTENLVVATGGGALQRPRNASYMKNYGVVVYLRMSVEEQLRRLSKTDSATRPLIADTENLKNSLIELHDKRNFAFEYSADYVIDVDNVSENDIIKSILSYIERDR